MHSVTKPIITLLYHEILLKNQISGFQNKDNIIYMHDFYTFNKHIDLILLNINSECMIQFSFDDGGISNINSADILYKNHLKGLFFIPTLFIGKHNFLSQSNIREINAKNQIIGSHSHTHPMIFRQLSYKKMLEEWKTSKQFLEEILQKEVLYCSIPGGDADLKTYESAAETGYKFIYNSEPTTKIFNINNAKIIGRFSITKKTSEHEFVKTILKKNHKNLQRKRAIKSSIKKIFFPIHYYIQNKKNVAK